VPGLRAARRARALALGAALLLVAPAAAQVKGPVAGPPDFEIPKAESSPGPVIFSHQQHRGKVAKCTTCHMKDFKMSRGQSGPITLEAKQEGKFCGACHDGKTTAQGTVVFPIDECDRCHKP
jgi:c(7)-type cytochrome triheme protein